MGAIVNALDCVQQFCDEMLLHLMQWLCKDGLISDRFAFN